jgi:hypothetical protein
VTGGASPAGPLPRARVLRGPGEIAEDDATGTLAAVYERVRGALGVPFVPTVFRMLARHERYLAAAIDSLRPVLDDRRGRELSARIRAIAAEAPAAAGIGVVPPWCDRGALDALIDRYNEANPRSLVLVRVLAREVPAVAGVMQPPLPQRAPHALLEEILACHGGLTVPGLWRELDAISPERAAAAWAAVRDAAHTSAFARAVREVIAAGDEAGAGCAAPTPAALGVDEHGSLEIERILGSFKILIPTMVVEIECLRRAFAGASTTP